MTAPRTSVVLCSAGRSPWFAEAVASVLEQTDTDLELLVVLDRDAQCPALPDDGRVRVVRSAPGCGAARAAGVAAARAEHLAFCDDDDTWTPDHLAVLHAALAETGADLVYGDSLLVTGDEESPGWSRDHDVLELAHACYVFASDVLARTEAVRAAGGPDPSLPSHEDWDLWLRMSLTGGFSHVPQMLGRRRWHEEAVLAQGDWETWSVVFDRHRRRVAALDLQGRLAVRRDALPHRPFLPATWTQDCRELVWQSRLSSRYGYGLVGRQLLRAVQRAGVRVLLAPSRDQVPADLADVPVAADHWGRLGFHYDLPGDPGALPVERVVSYFMWESDEVPARAVERINRHAALQLVPCADNVDTFRRSGVEVPLAVLRHGVDAARFPLLDRPQREELVFGSFSDLSARKGVDVLIRAFTEEFGPDEPVRLLLKGSGGRTAVTADHPRISVEDRFLDDAGLLRWLAGLDCFVLPSRGEGFGLPGLEAMATGLPLIATAWSGPAEYLDPADGYPLAYDLVDPGPRESGGVTYTGAWAEPRVDDLRRLLRHVADHRDEARLRGLAAARRVHDGWTWDHAAADLVAHLDRVGR